MFINIFGIWILASHILYTKPIDNGCQIVTSEKNVEYVSGMDCKTLEREISYQLRWEK